MAWLVTRLRLWPGRAYWLGTWWPVVDLDSPAHPAGGGVGCRAVRREPDLGVPGLSGEAPAGTS